MKKTDKFEVGTKVQITEKPKEYEDDPSWVCEMDKYKGKETTISKITGCSHHVYLKIDKSKWCWDVRWLKKVK